MFLCHMIPNNTYYSMSKNYPSKSNNFGSMTISITGFSPRNVRHMWCELHIQNDSRAWFMQHMLESFFLWDQGTFLIIAFTHVCCCKISLTFYLYACTYYEKNSAGLIVKKIYLILSFDKT